MEYTLEQTYKNIYEIKNYICALIGNCFDLKIIDDCMIDIRHCLFP